MYIIIGAKSRKYLKVPRKNSRSARKLLNNIVRNQVISQQSRPSHTCIRGYLSEKGPAPGAIRQRINEGQSACKCNANVC